MSNLDQIGGPPPTIVVPPLQNAAPPPQNAVPPPQNAVPPLQNAVPLPQIAAPSPQNAAVPLPPQHGNLQNAPLSPGLLAQVAGLNIPQAGQINANIQGVGGIGPQVPDSLGAARPAAVQGHGMNNVQFNANFGMNMAAIADQRAILDMQTCGTLAKAQMRADRWSRDLKINQETAKFRAPGDNKAVSYLVEEKFELKSYCNLNYSYFSFFLTTYLF